MSAMKWHPGSLLNTSGSYWHACTLHTGVKLGVFTQLGSAGMTAEQVADRLGADLRGITMLLNALAAMALVNKKDHLFSATAESQRYLDETSEEYIGYMIMHHHHLVPAWSQLDTAVLSGKPVRLSNRGDDAQRREAFLMGMYNIASQQAPQIASQIDLSSRRYLLDLGGGPGTYAIHFCLHNPELTAVVMDLPTTRPFAEKTIAKHGLSNRIEFIPGNYLKDPIADRYDAVWMSHILHAEDPSACEKLVTKVANALQPGGLMIIHDFILDDTMDKPLFPALFALNMLQGTDGGQSYSEAQICGMLSKAGVGKIRRLNYCGPTESGIISAIVGEAVSKDDPNYP